MKRVFKLLMVGALLALTVVPASAQDATDAAPSGGVIIDSVFGGGPTNFNIVTSGDFNAFQIIALVYPGLIGVNPETGIIEPNSPGAMSTSWDVSPDNLIYTFHMRDDLKWNDGVPVTAADFQAVWDAILTPGVQTNLVFLEDTIQDVKAIDDYTLQVTFKSASCEAFNDAGFNPIPAHLYPNGDYLKLNDDFYADANAPAIGPYKISSVIPDAQISLVPVNPDGSWPDGDVLNDGYAMKIVGDQTVQVQQLLAGETDVLNFVPVNARSDVRKAVDAGTLAMYEYNPGDAYDFVAFNTGNPKNPQPAIDDQGNPVEQEHHPLFGDVRVRQALAMAVDVDAMIQGAVYGEGTRMGSSYAQGTWPFDPNVPNYQFDPVAAGKLLDEAGFIDDDGDPTTPRVANDTALYAEPGTPFEFTLWTNDGNPRKAAIGTIMQDELSDIGVKVDFQAIDFDTMWEKVHAQTFDSFIGTWGNAYPFRADQGQLWSTTSDVIGGDNFTSYVNPELDKLMAAGLNVAGCDLKERAKVYGQIQEILHRDTPYLFLYSINGMYAWNPRLDGVGPYPAALYWNINEWTKVR